MIEIGESGPALKELTVTQTLASPGAGARESSQAHLLAWSSAGADKPLCPPVTTSPQAHPSPPATHPQPIKS